MADEEYINISNAPEHGVPLFVMAWLISGLGKPEENLKPNDYRRAPFQIKISTLKRIGRRLENLREKLREKGFVDEEVLGRQLGEVKLRHLIDFGGLKPSYFWNGLNFFSIKEVSKHIAAPTSQNEEPSKSPSRSRPPAKKINPNVIKEIDHNEITDDLISIQQATLLLPVAIPRAKFYNWVMEKQLLPVVQIRDRRRKSFLVRKADVMDLPNNPHFKKLLARNR